MDERFLSPIGCGDQAPSVVLGVTEKLPTDGRSLDGEVLRLVYS